LWANLPEFTRSDTSFDGGFGVSKRVYSFGGGKADGDAGQRNLLGGKGANLAEMTNLGLPVPPGFTITTEVCAEYEETGAEAVIANLKAPVQEALGSIEGILERKFGDTGAPLLLSVRSGARVSMPGMMDTVLNLGLNDDTVRGLAAMSDNERFALDSYRRFLQMFGDVVMGVDGEKFEHALDAAKDSRGYTADTQLEADDLRTLVENFKQIIRDSTGQDFPQDPYEQLWQSVMAVFRSWETDRAVAYRSMHGIPGGWGTAVNVQAMVFGNMGDDCATGVAFTRNPSTGEHAYYGEYLVNAQGEDVVAGVRKPLPIGKPEGGDDSLEAIMPEVHAQLIETSQNLEKHYRDMLDLEFTIQNGKLWMLQARSGKRTGAAAVRIAVEMVGEGLIDQKTALQRVSPEQLEQLLHPAIDPNATFEVLAKGLPASPGAVSGGLAFTAEEAVEAGEQGRKVLLVRRETSPEDIRGMEAAAGILTQRGGMTSHAAVVARGMGKCCIAGCSELQLDEAAGTLVIGGQRFDRESQLTLNGNTGEVLAGEVPTVEVELANDFKVLMEWANEHRRLRVRANSDTPEDSRRARGFGAEGIGLCRTEHMFFGEDRIAAVREMIVSQSKEQRERALAKLLPFQMDDFAGIFEAMDGLPVTIRLLDPPLHEFLPHAEDEIQRLARELDVPGKQMHRIVDGLQEFNPMLGHRGCRLGLSYPEIYLMQVEAVIRAACTVKRRGIVPIPEIMIPLVGIRAELAKLRADAVARADEVIREEDIELDYTVGTMIEIPRACMVADKIAEVADFFSFGTNDLTQMGFGFSRDDAGSFLPDYVESGVLPRDPFQSLDEEGIGALVESACRLGRQTKKDLKLGVCGEHGGDPSSVNFFHRAGLDYVSCSPYRVPVAILAAAQAALAD
jgi:pyruvate,orthophosphate dikinase